MGFKLGIVGGGLQGTEAASLARWSGWDSIVADVRPAPPARDLAGRFVNKDITTLSDLDKAFPGCDLVIPACEHLPTLELLSQWSRLSGQPLAFDLAAYNVSSDKERSKNLFYEREVPTPRPYPAAAYPLIAKPAGASGSRGVRLLNEPAELDRLFPDGDATGWVVEEYCPGPSYSLEVTGRPGAYKTWLTTFLDMDEVYDCRLVSSPAGLNEADEAALRQISLNIAEGLKLEGLMDVEVILTPRGHRVLEIDARLPSQTPTVVYWTTGVNLIAELAALFCSAPPPVKSDFSQAAGNELDSPLAALNAVVYEHVAVRPDSLTPGGEHIMAQAGPLWLEENFFGADWALTDRNSGRPDWAATIITMSPRPEDLAVKRAQVWERLKRR